MTLSERAVSECVCLFLWCYEVYKVMKRSVNYTHVFSPDYPASYQKTLVGSCVFAAAGSAVDVVAFAPGISCSLLTVCTA